VIAIVVEVPAAPVAPTGPVAPAGPVGPAGPVAAGAVWLLGGPKAASWVSSAAHRAFWEIRRTSPCGPRHAWALATVGSPRTAAYEAIPRRAPARANANGTTARNRTLTRTAASTRPNLPPESSSSSRPARRAQQISRLNRAACPFPSNLSSWLSGSRRGCRCRDSRARPSSHTSGRTHGSGSRGRDRRPER